MCIEKVNKKIILIFIANYAIQNIDKQHCICQMKNSGNFLDWSFQNVFVYIKTLFLPFK